MSQLMIWWMPVALIHFVLGLTRLFEKDKNGFRFSLWVKSGLVHIVLVFHVAILSSLQAGTATGIEGIPPLLVVLWYSIYACFTFGYRVTDSHFSWFNGIIRKTVGIVEVRSIVLRRKEERIVAFNLVLRTQDITVRNDFPQIEGLVRKLAKQHSIPMTEQQRP